MNNTWLDRNRNVIFALISTVALVGAGIFYWQRPSPEPIEIVPAAASATPEFTPTPAPSPTPAPVRVYVTGAVANSDVYFLPAGSIVKDAIQAAGGFTPDANPEGINQALQLQDQQQIHVPRLNEENPPPAIQGGVDTQPVSNEPAGAAAAPVNLNTATLEQLDSLPGIGPAIGQRIIEYRESTGGFSSIEEITQVSGIGEATFAKIKDRITVE